MQRTAPLRWFMVAPLGTMLLYRAVGGDYMFFRLASLAAVMTFGLVIFLFFLERDRAAAWLLIGWIAAAVYCFITNWRRDPVSFSPLAVEIVWRAALAVVTLSLMEIPWGRMTGRAT